MDRPPQQRTGRSRMSCLRDHGIIRAGHTPKCVPIVLITCLKLSISYSMCVLVRYCLPVEILDFWVVVQLRILPLRIGRYLTSAPIDKSSIHSLFTLVCDMLDDLAHFNPRKTILSSWGETFKGYDGRRFQQEQRQELDYAMKCCDALSDSCQETGRLHLYPSMHHIVY